jgi:hypothetical protein
MPAFLISTLNKIGWSAPSSGHFIPEKEPLKRVSPRALVEAKRKIPTLLNIKEPQTFGD